jgi:hypothetical protein
MNSVDRCNDSFSTRATFRLPTKLCNAYDSLLALKVKLGLYCRAIETDRPEEAVKLYLEAISVFEEEQKEGLASDLYRAAAAAMIKSKK